MVAVMALCSIVEKQLLNKIHSMKSFEITFLRFGTIWEYLMIFLIVEELIC